MIPKATLIVGILGLLLGGLVLIITLFVYATGAGHISGEEAAPGFIGGCACSFFSLIIAVVGIILVMKAKKQATLGTDTTSSAPPPPPAPPAPPTV